MNMKKKIGLIIISVILVPITVFLAITSPWWLLAIGLHLSPAPPKPEIRCEEFDFKLVYEWEGEIRTVEDTVVCEFDGFNIDEGRGKTRRWKEYLKNEQGNELYAFRVERMDDPAFAGYWRNRDPEYDQIVLQNVEHYKVVLSILSAEYFMGEPGWAQETDGPFVQVYDIDAGYYKDPEASDAFVEEYGFEVISWECDAPIVNTFKYLGIALGQ